MGCSDVVLESDSAVAVHLLNKAVDALHPLATLLWGCQDYIKNVAAALFIMSIVNAIWWLIGLLTWALTLIWVSVPFMCFPTVLGPLLLMTCVVSVCLGL
ncbi:unnamed protein product [Prunus brigantina]